MHSRVSANKSNACLRFSQLAFLSSKCFNSFVSATGKAGASQKTDGRRELGERTRQRLLEATRELLAERGEDAIRLRDITDAARVNVAAVNYHFGCTKALYRAAITEAMETIIDEQGRQLRELADDAALDEIVAAWTRPVIAALIGPPSEGRALMRIAARAGSDPPDELREWATATTARSRDELSCHLRRVLPDVPDHDLCFRTRCATGILHVLGTSSMQNELEGKTASELERLLVPVIAGALVAGAPPVG
ncbi:MAG: Transcriptional regulator TetR family [Solirubrobacterales bacterium]|nr:Transcriptional regulator TetR family [Solirubrobacterales bacterium]